ncbi:bZIP transcription factor [Thermomonas sp.]|uniref:bZIP transcription factor n=1 Tax=Thermomonas sp. TaxID=1971895 RepID=UPI0035B42C9B
MSVYETLVGPLHATLAVRNNISVIAPVATDPRCPTLIRSLLELYPDWTFGGNPIGTATARSITGSEDAEILLSELVSESRLRPIVVVSQNEDEFVWPRLPDELAYDLTGLASVVSVDDEASWALTEHLGKKNSCYMGAVRLYWPGKKSVGGDIQIPGTVWTASTLLSMDHDGKGLGRFRSAIRRAVMSVAALTVEAPSTIRHIQNFYARQRLQELEARANSNTEELELARLYVEENEELKAEVAQLRTEISALSGRAEVAEYALSQAKGKEAQVADIPATDDDSPVTGETRYYKKTHSKQAYDVLVRVTDCGHTSWQNSAGADKARKGVERLEKRSDWKSLHHCGSCTGGGLWRVRW